MWTHMDQNFSTPPPTRRKQRSLPSPKSERKRASTPSSVNKKGDIFHVIHKVPSGDSPYVRAKHIQLIDKDPSRAVSMFWAAINAGDRVDSALKDMAVVMKQLDRSDEAIEAIKSFRHLCPCDSQESLDNVLIELYKRSGRIEEEIELLQNKLKNIEEGIIFGGAKTKLARSQGKKIHITIDQERSRILGNLAWAYLQQNNYEMAEQYYMRALSLGVDNNKKCNLAICLMHMNRIIEAKSLLQAVRDSAGSREMDSSYARSFECAIQMLTELESPSVIKPTELEEDEDRENQRPFAYADNGNFNLEVAGSTREGQNPAFSVCRSLEKGHGEQTVLLNEQDRSSYSRNYLEEKHRFLGYDIGSLKCKSSGPRETSQFSTHTTYWRTGSYPKNPSGRSSFACAMNENCGISPGIAVSSAHQGTCVSPAAVRRNLEVLFTQPRRPSRKFSNWKSIGSSNINLSSEETVHSVHSYSTVLFTQPRRLDSQRNMEHQRQAKRGEKPVGCSIRKLTFEQAITTDIEQARGIPILNGEQLVPTEDESKIGLPNSKNAVPSPSSNGWIRRSWEDITQVKDEPVKQPLLPLIVDGNSKLTCWKIDGSALKKNAVVEFDSQHILGGMQKMKTFRNGDDQNKFALDKTAGEIKTFIDDQCINEKSNILQQSVAEKPKSSQDCFKTKEKKSWADMVEEEENEAYNENLNSNIAYPRFCPQNQIDYLSQKFESSYATPRNAAALPSRNLKARRFLCFDQQQRPESKVHFYSSPLPNKGSKFEIFNSSAPGTSRRSRLQVFEDITPFQDSP